MRYDVIIVGAGLAGLICAAYLSKNSHKVLLCEKREKTVGLVGSSSLKGYVFNFGIRAFENSGIILPMLKELGISINFKKSTASVGIEEEMIHCRGKESLFEYRDLLIRKFPEEKVGISRIINEIEKIIGYLDVLYGIDNSLFIDYKNSKKYLFKTFLPWLIKYQINIKKAVKLNTQANEYLPRFTRNKSLIDMITQHFFKKTPTFFALSYFGLYLDYIYLKGGTGVLVDKIEDFFKKHNGILLTNCKIKGNNISDKEVITKKNKRIAYQQLVWAADMKTLYDSLSISHIKNDSIKSKINAQKNVISRNIGSNTFLSVYLQLDIEKLYFDEIIEPHAFYTPYKIGILHLEYFERKNEKEKIAVLKKLIKSYLRFTTYEISYPVLIEESLAPEGKTGLIVSTLMDYKLTKYFHEINQYDEFKTFCRDEIIHVLNDTIFKGISSKIISDQCSTPLSIKKITGNFEGGITRWSFASDKIPAVYEFPKIAKSAKTPISEVFQAGQWTFSLSGLPISILTGKLAANAVVKNLKKIKSKGKNNGNNYN